MDLVGSAYLYVLAAVSTTFVGFSALIMTFRQATGGGLSRFESFVTQVFVHLGFLVTAGSLTPPLLALCGLDAGWIWRGCSIGVAVVVGLFGVTYPARRRAVSGAATPLVIRIDAALLAVMALAFVSNAAGWPTAPGAGLYAFGLTGTLFVTGLGYLHALGGLSRGVPGDRNDAGA
ncbi:MAG TPA: hypothetical protein VGL58_06675 [Caulobacteraceae bacterium]|jgi:hypothetical protein